MSNESLNPNLPPTKVPALPPEKDVVALARAIKQLLEVREGQRGSPLDANVTWRSLVNAGIADISLPGGRIPGGGGGGPFVPPVNNQPDPTDRTPPPKPLGLAAEFAISNVMLTWFVPIGYANLAYTEVWRAAYDTLSEDEPLVSDAIMIGTTSGYLYADNVGPSSPQYRYWIRFISKADVPGEFSDHVDAQTPADPGWLLDLLEGQLTQDQLHADLGSRIDAISTLQDQMMTLSAGAGEQFDSAKIWYFDTGIDGWSGNGTPVATAGWVRPASHATDAYLTSPSNLAIDGAAFPQVKMRIRRVGTPTWEGNIWWRPNTSTPWSIDGRMTFPEPTFDDNDIAVVTINVPWSGTINGIRVDLSSGSTAFDNYECDWIAIGRAAPGASTVALQQEAQVRASETGALAAKYTVKIDANGYVSGFGLASTANNSTPTSTFAVRADSFYVASPSGPGVAPTMPFIIRTTPTTINGQVVPAGVYMRDVFIENGTITSLKIGKLQVDDAHIIKMTAGKLTAGQLSIGTWIASQNYSAGSQGWLINAEGWADLANATVRGTIYATNGLIGDLVIAPGQGVRSSNYVWNDGPVSGFHLNSDGNAAFGNVTVRGTVTGSTINGSVINGGAINGTTVNSVTVNTSTLNAPTLNGGYMRGINVPTNVIDLNAQWGGYFIHTGTQKNYGPYAGTHFPVEIKTDGSAFFARGIVSGGTKLASGTRFFDALSAPRINLAAPGPGRSESGD